MSNKRIFGNEHKYIKEVLKNEFRSSKNSFMVSKLEDKFCKIFNSQYAISFVNGTATMHACLEAMNIGAGDEVIVPPLTMSATALAVLHCNATPIFSDVDINTFQISNESIKKKITKKTKAIITVSLYGLSPEMDEIKKTAKINNLFIIEDNAECFLGYYKNKIVGNLGDCASFSFQSSKHISCGEGGIVITNNQKLAKKIRSIQSLGYLLNQNKNQIKKYNLMNPNYSRHYYLGWNYRMSDLCAAVALGQLENIKYFVELRKKSAFLYNNAAKDFSWFIKQNIPKHCIHSYWTWAGYIKDKKIKWINFKNKFIEFGGSALYAAWKLSYNEPVFKKLNFNKREKMMTNNSTNKNVNKDFCANSEYLQPRLFQFKTNFYNNNEAKKEAIALRKTLQFFN